MKNQPTIFLFLFLLIIVNNSICHATRATNNESNSVQTATTSCNYQEKINKAKSILSESIKRLCTEKGIIIMDEQSITKSPLGFIQDLYETKKITEEEVGSLYNSAGLHNPLEEESEWV